MRPLIRLGLAVVAVLAIAACGNQGYDEKGTPGTEGTAGAANIDRDFVQDMLASGSAEVELGRLAEQRASSPDVRAFAETIVRDHTKAGDELKRVANQYQIPASPPERDEHARLRERLTRLSGADFDREYIDAMIDAHQKSVNKLEAKTDDDNPDLRRWAEQTLPTVKQHLERAKAIQEQLRR